MRPFAASISFTCLVVGMTWCASKNLVVSANEESVTTANLSGVSRVPSRRLPNLIKFNDTVYSGGTPDGPDARLGLEDVTTNPPQTLDLEAQAGETLYELGLWPVAQVRVRTVAVSSAAAAAERRALQKDGWIII